jgi:hypothetical protein
VKPPPFNPRFRVEYRQAMATEKPTPTVLRWNWWCVASPVSFASAFFLGIFFKANSQAIGLLFLALLFASVPLAIIGLVSASNPESLHVRGKSLARIVLLFWFVVLLIGVAIRCLSYLRLGTGMH